MFDCSNKHILHYVNRFQGKAIRAYSNIHTHKHTWLQLWVYVCIFDCALYDGFRKGKKLFIYLFTCFRLMALNWTVLLLPPMPPPLLLLTSPTLLTWQKQNMRLGGKLVHQSLVRQNWIGFLGNSNIDLYQWMCSFPILLFFIRFLRG